MVKDVVIAVSVMMIAGFLMTRITKLLRLPNVTAYLLAGILLRPLFTHGVLNMAVIDGMAFFPDVALAFIAFSIGQYFRLPTLRKNGGKVLVISLFDCVLTTGLVFLLLYVVCGLGFELSLILGSVASVTGITSIVIIVRATDAKGEFVDTMLEVIALDTLVSIVLYSVAISVALAVQSGGFHAGDLFGPILTNLLVFLLGGVFGVVLKWLMPKKRTTDNRLIIAVATLFGLCGICAVFGVSPLIGCMSMGTVYYNVTGDDRLFKQLGYFSPPILLLFFVRSGVSFDFGVFRGTSLILVVILFILVRWGGKYLGSFLGATVTKKPESVRRYLGLTLAPLGSIAIGLAALASAQLSAYPDLASTVNTVILASTFVYELFGPALGKLSLSLSHSYSDTLEDLVPVPEYSEDGKKKTDADLLVERIRAISASLPEVRPDENETAFNEAADEQLFYRDRRPGLRRGGRFFK